MDDLHLHWSDGSGEFFADEIDDLDVEDEYSSAVALHAEAEITLENVRSQTDDTQQGVADCTICGESAEQREIVDTVVELVEKLPAKIAAKASEKTLSLTSDFAKLLQLLPESPITGKADVKGLKAITLDGNQLRLEGKAKLEIPMDGISVPLTFDNFSADIKADPKNPDKLILTNIKGLRAESLGVVVHMQELSLSFKRNGDKLVPVIEVPKLNAVAPPGPLGYLAKDKVAELNRKGIPPTELPLESQDAVESLQKVVTKLHEWALKKDSDKDASLLLKDLIESFAREEVSLFLQGVQGVERDGENLTIRTDGEDRFIGGLPLKFEKDVTAQLRVDDGSIELKNLKGVAIGLSLPAEVAKATGLKDPLPITGLTLGKPDSEGNRLATISVDGMIKSVTIKVGPDLKPVPVDGKDNVMLTVTTDGGKLDLVFNIKEAQQHEPDKMSFKLSVSEGDIDLTSSVIDSSIAGLIKGVKEIEKSGEHLTIKLKEAHSGSVAGMPLNIENTITARVVTEGGKFELRNIQGIKLTLPPEVAKSTGLDKMNLSIEDVTLSAPDKNGHRIATLRMGGFIEQVQIQVVVGYDMQPVPVDHDGNIALKIAMKNGQKLSADLIFNPEGAEGKTKCVYAQLFKRQPDYPGCNWMIEKFESGATFKEVVKLAIANEAREFKNAVPQNKAEIIPFLYQRILNRHYGPGEDNGIYAKLLEEKGIDAVIDSLMESAEFKNNHPDVRVKVTALEGADDVVSFIEKMRGQELDKTLKDVLRGVQSFSIQNDKRMVLKAKQARQLGDLPLFADANVSLLLSAQSFEGEIRATDVSGVKVQLPVPGDVLGKLQCPADAPVKGVAVVPIEKNNRLVQVDFEHPIFKQAAFIVDASGKPLIEAGRMRARVKVDVNGKAAECLLDLPAEQKPGARSYISFKGDPAAKVELLKRLGTPAEFAEVAGEVAGVSIVDNSVILHFDKPTSVTMKGVSMKFEKDVAITAHKPQRFGVGQFVQDMQGFSVQGVEVSGFNFGGDQWQRVGSVVLNQYLREQNDLPIRITSLYFGTSPNDQQLRVGFFADQGMVKHAQFTLESKDNPTFVDGSVTIKNPFRYLNPTNRFWNNDYEMTVRLNQNGIQKPAATVRDTARPIIDDPILRFLPPVQTVRTGLAVAEFIEDLFDW